MFPQSDTKIVINGEKINENNNKEEKTLENIEKHLINSGGPLTPLPLPVNITKVTTPKNKIPDCDEKLQYSQRRRWRLANSSTCFLSQPSAD